VSVVDITNTPATEISIKDNLISLTDRAAKIGVKVVDLSDGSGMRDRVVPETVWKNQKTFLSFLKKSFINIIIASKDNETTVYILPKGINSTDLGMARTFLEEAEAHDLLSGLSKARRIHGIPAKEIPEVVTLQTLAEIERIRTINYQRFVNPDVISAAYTFSVKFDPRFNALVPYLKNGQPIIGEMEGFTSFNSILNFITTHTDELQVFREGANLYLRIKGDAGSVMVLTGTLDRFEVASKARPKNGPSLDIYLAGDISGFTSMSKINHDTGTLTLVDIAVRQ
jgi:hypothetical protein